MIRQAASALFALATFSSAASGADYTATRLSPNDADRFTLNAINGRGAVVGTAWKTYVDDWGGGYIYGEGLHYADGVFRCAAGSSPVLPCTDAQVVDINDDGDGAGGLPMIYDPWEEHPPHAFRTKSGAVIDVHPPFARSSQAKGINRYGDVAGEYVDIAGKRRVFIAPADAPAFDLGTLGEAMYAAGINARRQVAGSFAPGDGSLRAYRYANGALEDLGTLGGGMSVGTAINANGDVAGYSIPAIPNGLHAFLFTGGAMIDLGTLGGSASFTRGMNSLGQVVGTSTRADGALRAFLYAGGSMRDLNESVVAGLDGAVLADAVAINDAGQIVARACVATGDTSCAYFLLNPVPTGRTAAVEYRHAGFVHYFLTANTAEIAKLDSGATGGWTRTGLSVGVFSGPQAGSAPVCRFFSAAFAPKSSHFYTSDADECVAVKRNADWQAEGIAFYAVKPDLQGGCGAGTRPAFRLYNDGAGGAPNHRVTTDANVRAQMIAAGWIPEGEGPLGITFCAAD